MSDESGRMLLASLLDDVVAEQDDSARTVELDFAAVVARAGRVDSSRPARLVDEAHRLAAMREDQLLGAARIGDLDMLVEAARARLVLVGAASERAGLPPLRVDAVHRRRPRVWAAAMGIAALFVAALSLGWGLTARTLEREDTDDYSGANQIADDGEWSQARIDDTPRPQPRPRARVERAPALAPAPVVTTPTKPRAAARPSVGDRLEAIDARGRAAWKQGDLANAEAAFVELVHAGGRRPIVDIAYGDLFELARQRHDPAKEARLWLAYLKRFPNGRYADEARAGACRRAQGNAARECWRSYLADRPRGTYRDRARAALGLGATEPTPAR